MGRRCWFGNWRWGTSLTGRSVLATLDDDSPVRLTALATGDRG